MLALRAFWSLGGSGVRPNRMASAIEVMPYMMDPGEDRIVADAIYEALTKPRHYDDPVIPSGTPARVQGKWAVSIRYTRGVGEQHFTLEQRGNELTGTQQGELYKAELREVFTLPRSNFAATWPSAVTKSHGPSRAKSTKTI